MVCVILTLARQAAASPVASSEAPAGQKPAPLTSIAEIRALSPAEAERARPVRIRGVVTWHNWVKGGSLVTDDGLQGILVASQSAIHAGIWTGGDLPPEVCEPGALVEIEGITAAGHAPFILPLRIQRVGTGPLPPARPVTVERLLSGVDAFRRVEVVGVVQSVIPLAGTAGTILYLSVGGHICTVRVAPDRDVLDGSLEKLVDARVRVGGVFYPQTNIRGEPIGLSIRVARPGDVVVLTPPPPDPFEAPHVALDRLLPFVMQGVSMHRKVTQGVVSFSLPNEFFFLQDGRAGVRVEAPGMVVEVGERVEVAGFVETTRWIASLTGAVARSLGREPVPDALPVTISQILTPEGWSTKRQVARADCDSRLVRLRGVLRRIETKDPAGGTVLQIESENHVFPAELPTVREADQPMLQSWTAGSTVELTGVCELEFSGRGTHGAPLPPSGFRLWLRSPHDIQVLHAPSWWTLPRVVAALAVTLLVLGVAAIWITTLRRTLRQHTARLEEAMHHYRNSELEFLAARQERLRLAADLHDGLQHMIAGVGFRLEAAMGYIGEPPAAAQEEFAAARRALLAAQAGLREYLWGLREVDEGPGDFAALLRHAVDSMEHWPRGTVEVVSSGTPFDLSRDVMGNLLLLMQEAVGNALRHGGAGRVRVALNYDAEGLELRIEDEGQGFDQATVQGPRQGHFGLEGMRERVRRIGGRVEITSVPGKGTCVAVRLSLRSADGAVMEWPFDPAWGMAT